MTLRAIALNCSLKGIREKEKSSTDALLQQVLDELERYDVTTSKIVRVVDHDIKPGVRGNEGKGDDWPDLLMTPKEVKTATAQAVANAVHVATLLNERNYPGVK